MKGCLIAALLLLGAPALAQDAARPGAVPGAVPDVVPDVPPGADMPEVEMLHGWDGPESDAVLAVLGAAFESRTPYRWTDGGAAGEALVVSRIIGGDPPAAVQIEHGRKAAELARGGFLLDITELAERGGWRDRLVTPTLLDACTVDGRVYCVPVTLRAGGWLTLSRAAFARAGLDVPSDWAGLSALAGPLDAAGVTALEVEPAAGPLSGLLAALVMEAGGRAAWVAALRNGDVEALTDPAPTRGFEAFATARDLARPPGESGVADGRLGRNLVIGDAPGTGGGGGAAAELSGDGSWGKLRDARRTAGGDHKCLPGLGGSGPLAVTGDAFYFPVRRDADLEPAQLALAAFLFEPEVQVALSAALGVLPARRDVDITSLYACARKGLVAVATRGAVPARDLMVPLAAAGPLDELLVAFWNDADRGAADLQAEYIDILERTR